MGLVYAPITLSNPRDATITPMKVKALVDTGAITLCIPEHIAVQLNLEHIEKREVKTADDTIHVVPYAGPVKIQFENRTCFTGALILGNSILIGAVPLEDMDLVVSSRHRKVTVNPDSPNIPTAIVK